MAKEHKTIEQLREAGCKIKPYMTEDEMIDWCKIGLLAGEMEVVANKYHKVGWKQWAAYLRTCVTLADKVLTERLVMLDQKAMRALINRRNNAKMVIDINYGKRALKDEKEMVTIDLDMFSDTLEMSIIQTCEGCKRSDFADCRYHEIYLAMCVPVIHNDEGVCPYQYDMFLAATAGDTAPNNQLATNTKKKGRG